MHTGKRSHFLIFWNLSLRPCRSACSYSSTSSTASSSRRLREIKEKKGDPITYESRRFNARAEWNETLDGQMRWQNVVSLIANKFESLIEPMQEPCGRDRWQNSNVLCVLRLWVTAFYTFNNNKQSRWKRMAELRQLVGQLKKNQREQNLRLRSSMKINLKKG